MIAGDSGDGQQVFVVAWVVEPGARPIFCQKRPSIGVKETYYRAESRGTVLASKLAATAPMAVDNIESMYYDMIRTFPNNNLQGFLLFSPCISALF
jgi:hypothetical protein